MAPIRGAPRAYGFFFRRLPLDLDVSIEGGVGGLAEYLNVPPSIGTAISSGKATLAELSTVLSLEDLWDLLEVNAVDAHNQRIIDARNEAKKRK